MITKILVATDGSKTSQKAVSFAVGLAKQTGASIKLTTVIDKSFFLTQTVPSKATPLHIKEPIEDYLQKLAEAHLRDAEQLCKKRGIQVQQSVRSGHPVQEIIREAKKSKVDLIVIGSHGRSALKATMLGSVSFGVIHKETRIPVLVVKK